jgi:uncharacterized protein
MELLGVRLELPMNVPVLLLREQEGARRVLPIYIAPEEAQAIERGIKQFVPPRPLTHDLLRDVLEALGATLVRLVVTELRESDQGGGTFFAELVLELPGGTTTVSSRPSDGVALAVRTGAPIFVADDVLDRAATAVADEEEGEGQEEIVDQFREFLDEVNPEDFAS